MARKSKNFKKKPLWLHFKPKQVGKGWKREKIRIIISFRSYPMHKRQLKKKVKKLWQKKKNPIMASFQAKIGWTRRRKRENKNCLSVPFLPDGKYKIPKK